MSLYKDKQIKELYDMRHRNDNFTDKRLNVEENILKKAIPPFTFQNDIMNGFLLGMQKMAYLLFDHVNVLRNFKNHMVEKDYDQHIN